MMLHAEHQAMMWSQPSCPWHVWASNSSHTCRRQTAVLDGPGSVRPSPDRTGQARPNSRLKALPRGGTGRNRADPSFWVAALHAFGTPAPTLWAVCALAAAASGGPGLICWTEPVTEPLPPVKHGRWLQPSVRSRNPKINYGRRGQIHFGRGPGRARRAAAARSALQSSPPGLRRIILLLPLPPLELRLSC